MGDPRANRLLRPLASRLDRRRLLQTAAALGAAGVAAPLLQNRTALAARQADATTLVVVDNVRDNWISLDPARFYEVNSSQAMAVIYEGLYYIPDGDKPTEFAPLLATELPTFSDDGLEATIAIRSGVKFQNTGNEMTADDWVFSWNRLANLKDNPSFYVTEYITSVEAVDPHTLKITLPFVNAALVPILSALSMGVTDSKAIVAAGGSDGEPPASGDPARDFMLNNSAGTGPFRLTQLDLEGEVIVERHPDYWGEAPKLERIIWRNIADPNSQTQAVEVGEADIAYSVDPDAVSQIEGDANLQVLRGPSFNIGYLALHTQPDPGGPLAKQEIRQAIASAIDYDAILQDLAAGAAVRSAAPVPLGLQGAEEVLPDAWTLDLEKAQQLFDESGVGPTEITLTYGADKGSASGVPLESLVAKIQSDLQKIQGLTVNLEPMDEATRLQSYREGKIQFTYSVWSADYSDVHTYADPFGRTGGAAAKRVGYSNPKVDELLKQGISELDPAKRTPLYIDIQKLMIDDAPFLVIDQPVEQKPARANVQGAQVHPIYMIALRNASKTE
ncbi:MAG: ABC transporter substrate-binding protein [Thermomicrobiales bacterium]|nr:ABC transporter substrate-binding protein [Thermomicrobiales bacterium]